MLQTTKPRSNFIIKDLPSLLILVNADQILMYSVVNIPDNFV